MAATLHPIAAGIAGALTAPAPRADLVITIALTDGTPVRRYRALMAGPADDTGRAIGDWLDDHAVRYAEQPLSGPVEPFLRAQLVNSLAAYEELPGTPERIDEEDDGFDLAADADALRSAGFDDEAA